MRLLFRMLLIVAGISLSSAAARAEEGLTGHYFPGGLSSFVDMLPEPTGELTLGYANESTYYHGSNIAFNVNATSYTDTSVFLLQIPGLISILPGKPQYSVALAVPYTWLKVHAQGSKDTDNGFGDVEMFPVMLGWKKVPAEGEPKTYSLSYQTELGIYAPTGNFDSGTPANIGRNYWTFEPSAAGSYLLALPPTNPYAFAFTTSVGFDFNTKNGATHYQTGDEFHLDGTLAAHTLLFGGLAGAGVSGYFYQQITGDSGSGAVLGGFEAMTTGVGPDLSYAYKNPAAGLTIGGDVKWLPELSVSNRLSGNIVWLKLVVAWGAPSASFQATTPTNVRALDILPSL
jgi:hypothetical protein